MKGTDKISESALRKRIKEVPEKWRRRVGSSSLFLRSSGDAVVSLGMQGCPTTIVLEWKSSISTMISLKELRNLCEDRIKEAEALVDVKLYDGAYYLCGYAVEIALKKRICKTLRWNGGYPRTDAEFKNLTSFKTHDLDMLLHLSGIEDEIKQRFFSEWSIVTVWKPEMRYASRTKNEQMAKGMLQAVKRLLEQL
jgi:hypothetical protein